MSGKSSHPDGMSPATVAKRDSTTSLATDVDVCDSTTSQAAGVDVCVSTTSLAADVDVCVSTTSLAADVDVPHPCRAVPLRLSTRSGPTTRAPGFCL